MKISCHCGALIVDQTDYLPHKGHLIPDQDWFNTDDAIDGQVIDPVAEGRMSKEEAYHAVRRIISRAARLMWQCRECGRLYIDNPHRELECFLPEGDGTDRQILRGSSPEVARSGSQVE